MKIVLVVPSLNEATGAVRRLVTLAQALEGRGHSVALCSSAETSLWRHMATEANLPYSGGQQRRTKAIPQKRRSKALRALALSAGYGDEVAGLKAAFARLPWQPDAVIARNALGVLAARSAMPEVPLIWDIGIETRQPLRHFMFVLAAHAAGAIVMQSRRQSSKIFGMLAPFFQRRVVAIIPAIHLEASHGTGTKPGWLPEVPVVLQVATLCRRKNQLTTLRAFRLMIDQLPATAERPHLVLVGGADSPGEWPALKSEAERLGIAQRVQWVGWQDDARSALPFARLLVLPSLDEGVPNVIQEAMWLGVPVAAAGVGGIPDLVEHGVTGWLHRAMDANALAAIMLGVFQNPQSAIDVAAVAQERARRDFVLSSWAERYEAVLNKVVAAHRLVCT